MPAFSSSMLARDPDLGDGFTVAGVSAAIFRDGTVLLVQRAKDPYARLWSLPGGRVEPGEKLLDAVRRELREETGLEARALRFEQWHEVPRANRGDDATTRHVIAVHTGISDKGEPLAGDDAANAHFVPLNGLCTLRTTPMLAEVVRHCARRLSIPSTAGQIATDSTCLAAQQVPTSGRKGP